MWISERFYYLMPAVATLNKKFGLCEIDNEQDPIASIWARFTRFSSGNPFKLCIESSFEQLMKFFWVNMDPKYAYEGYRVSSGEHMTRKSAKIILKFPFPAGCLTCKDFHVE